MRISDWSSDVCSSDLEVGGRLLLVALVDRLDVGRSGLRRGKIGLSLQQRSLGVGVVEARHDVAFRDFLAFFDIKILQLAGDLRRHRPLATREDRKGGVAGKRVYIQLNLGGSRI